MLDGSSATLPYLLDFFFMSIEGSAKFVYEHRLVLVMRIEVSLIFGEFMGIECASSHYMYPILYGGGAEGYFFDTLNRTDEL